MKVLKVGVVAFWLIASLFCALNPYAGIPRAQAAATAVFYTNPSSGRVKIGDRVSATIFINTGGQAINSGQASVSFSSDILEYQSFSTAGSIFTFWTSGPVGTGTAVNFGGGLSTPGYNGTAGNVLTIYWKAKAEGTATITVNGSKILANDGVGTNVLASSTGASIVVYDPAKEPKTPTPTPKPKVPTATVVSSSHPDQDKWYPDGNLKLSWSTTDPAAGYSFVLDQIPNTEPIAAISKVLQMSYDGLTDGVWYFHIRSENTEGKGKTTHFRIQVDTEAPDAFSVNVTQEGGASNPYPKIAFETTDGTSGIDRYEAILDGGEPFAISNGDQLAKQRPGSHSILIRAYDKAGNRRESEASFKVLGIDPPVILGYNHFVGLLDPITFTGRSKVGDTIHVYLDDKEVDSFKVEDKKISEDGGEVTWSYTYNKQYIPGAHNFRFSRTDSRDADSELTQPLPVQVEVSTIKIGDRTFATKWVLLSLLSLLIILILLITYLVRLIIYMRKHRGLSLKFVTARLKKLFDRTEKELVAEVEEFIPDQKMTKAELAKAKDRLEEKIHETLEEELSEEVAAEKKAEEDNS